MFKRAMRRWKGTKLAYLAVFEETKRGEPHLHILMRAPYIPQKWISDRMAELIEAPIVDIRRVSSPKAVASYVAKYVAKGPKSFGTLKRYWQTQDYDLDRERKEKKVDAEGWGWRVVQEPLFLIAESWGLYGHKVCWVTEHEICEVRGPP